MNINQRLLSLLLPATCVSCRGDLPANVAKPICDSCWKAIHWRSHLNLPLVPFKNCYVPALFEGPLKDVIHFYKYSGRDYLHRFLAELWLSRCSNSASSWDVVVPVPSPYWKTVHRGYNPSALLAKELSRKLGLPFVSQVLGRRWWTQSQTKLGRKDRQRNAGQSYFVRRSGLKLREKRVLLVDDVLTTGSTMKACANLLLKIEVKSVSGAAVAYEEHS